MFIMFMPVEVMLTVGFCWVVLWRCCCPPPPSLLYLSQVNVVLLALLSKALRQQHAVSNPTEHRAPPGRGALGFGPIQSFQRSTLTSLLGIVCL